MKKIKINEINEYQKNIIRKGLVDYSFIQNNIHTKSIFFETTYYNFYLKARRLPKNNNKGLSQTKSYFKLLYECSSKFNLENILSKINKFTKKWDLVIATKLMHTLKPSKYPIYDSTVNLYLSKVWKVKFKNLNTSKNKIDDSLENYRLTCEYYKNPKTENERLGIIKWFDKNIPEYKQISQIKKIDFVIFSWVKTQNLIEKNKK